MSRSDEFANSRTAHIAEISDSKSEAHDDLWTTVSKGGVPQAVARLEGGWDGPLNWGYEPFPEGQAQGELFNVKTPKLAGWYKAMGASSEDAAAALGLALDESKKRYGRLPEPDTYLSPDSARVVARITGKDTPATYLEEMSKAGRQAEGDVTTSLIGGRVQRAYNMDGPKSKAFSEGDIASGIGTVRGLLRGPQFNGEKAPANTPTKNSLKSPVEQPTLPGL
jgi:hypothetical protein